ncbi:SDR family NAD(P)-dependent oxidoreductase [Aquisalimonas sp.]|uniref:SDR family NAD(P)-dependent oxidoreductase n=1 Tax=Aquisalimonas sp. TaxID=1872621 RepID=UPI0025BBC85E|nr:SDR family NAD(P)-dependent oxidoreductase [Aquisalimonas sp.]
MTEIYGLIGAADLPPYHASKGAVRLMSKNDALFYAQEKTRVKSIHPAYIWTPLVEQLGKQHPDGNASSRIRMASVSSGSVVQGRLVKFRAIRNLPTLSGGVERCGSDIAKVDTLFRYRPRE